MNSVKQMSCALALALTIGVATTAPVSAVTTTADKVSCTAKTVGTTNTAGSTDSRFIVDGTSVSTIVEVKGDEACKQTVTFAVWQAPDAVKGLPYDQQKLLAHKTESLSVGKHVLSLTLPNCFYQVDLVHGS